MASPSKAGWQAESPGPGQASEASPQPSSQGRPGNLRPGGRTQPLPPSPCGVWWEPENGYQDRLLRMGNVEGGLSPARRPV